MSADASDAEGERLKGRLAGAWQIPPDSGAGCVIALVATVAVLLVYLVNHERHQ